MNNKRPTKSCSKSCSPIDFCIDGICHKNGCFIPKESSSKNMVELFCGSATVSKVFAEHGYNTFTVDNRFRKGTCEPNLKIDIMDLSIDLLPFSKVDFLWIGLPCDVWSYASGDKHWHNKVHPTSKKCLDHIALLHKTMQLIQQIKPSILIIENPRGRLRRYPPFVEFCKNNNIYEHTVTLSSYGFITTKPTNLFCSQLLFGLDASAPFGRGAKCNPVWGNLTKVQRQKTPALLIHHIIQILNL